MNNSASAGRRLAMADGIRAARDGTDNGRKEWSHFCIFGGRNAPQLIVNYSLSDGVQAPGLGNIARLVTMAACEDGWRGAVTRFDQSSTQFTQGAINLTFGKNSLQFVDNCYELHIDTEEISAALKCRPRLAPVIPPNARLGAGYVRWMIAPLLEASGYIRVDDRHYEISAAPAYHDHNWGQFRWGDGFGWEWAIALDDIPRADKAVILTRITNNKQNAYVSNVLLVWDGDSLYDFRGSWLTSAQRGTLRKPPQLRIPGPLDLVTEGIAADIPELIRLQGKTSDNEITLDIRTESYGQIGIPNDNGGYGISILTEAHARACASGTLNGRTFRLDGPAVYEIAGRTL